MRRQKKGMGQSDLLIHTWFLPHSVLNSWDGAVGGGGGGGG